MKSILSTLLVGTVVALIGGVGFAYSGLYDVSATSPHWPVSNWLMKTTMHASVERRAGEIVVPELNDAMKQAGANDFETMCVSCHGSPQRGPNAMGQGLNPKALDLTQSAKHLMASELYWITKNGIKMTGMPAWSASHTDAELWPVVAFMIELPNLDAAGYARYLERASGAGHHASPHEAKEVDEKRGHPAPVEKPVHDHSKHEH
jgi:mono/diheme cytochrome c family protein